MKPPRASKIYKASLAVIALRAQGVKMAEISETLGYSADTLRQYLSQSYKRGWINATSFNDVEDELEYVIKHEVTKNVRTVLSERTADGAVTSGAREMTIEAAKGLGLFKTHQISKTEGGATLGVALRVQVEMPPSVQGSVVTVRPGTIGGAVGLDIPVDAEVVETTEES